MPAEAEHAGRRCDVREVAVILGTVPSVVCLLGARVAVGLRRDQAKTERTSFEVPTVSLHVHERIDPRSIIEAVRKMNGEDFVQGSLFSRTEENPPIRDSRGCSARFFAW